MIQNLFAKAKLTYEGRYRGVVAAINDPLELGRVRVRVFGMSDNPSIPIAAVPWAKPAHSVMNGSIAKFGSFWVPDINSKVSVEFEAGNPLSPIYISDASDALDGVPSFVTTNYPYRVGFALSNGIIMYFDKSTNDVMFTHPSGTTIEIDPQGDVKITSAQDVDVNTTRDVNVTSARDIVMTANRNISLTAAQTLTILGQQQTNITFTGAANITCDSTLTITGPSININP